MKKKHALLLVVILVIVTVALLFVPDLIPYETYLKQVVDYDNILMQQGNYCIAQDEEENNLYFVGIIKKPFASKLKRTALLAEFNLESRTLTEEWFAIKNSGPLSNEFAEKARRDFYIFNLFYDVENDLPRYHFYMGISDIQPTYENLGPGISQLQCVEVDGLYAFIFLEDYSLYLTG